ncbi:MAG: CBS domain-containing protein [Anaerolineae bacterium]|nr:CBS domain-containing protein [Anaerolineae bacterium]
MPVHSPTSIILTHENADLDAIAALFGASKLYPEAIPVLPRRVNRNARHFLTLYGADMGLKRVEELDRRRITHVILVDTQSMVTIKGMVQEPEVQVVDHHPLSRELRPGWSFSGDVLGAATTLLIEWMVQENVLITPIEATLFLLGIYEDTGSLSYLTTTPRDVHCVAWLLEQGASLEIANDFLHYPLTPDQRELQDVLAENIEMLDFAGHSVIVASASFPRYVEEISVLAHKLRDLYEPSGLFLLVEFDNQVQLIARSASDAIDVAVIALAFGGGGHGRASAALIRDMPLSAVKQRLSELLKEHIQPATTVRQIMSFGVRTLVPSMTIIRAYELMQRYGHEGFPVLEDGHVVGVLSRRETERAIGLGLEHAAISTYMTKGTIQVRPDEPIEMVQQVMMDYGIGQVPVVSESGKLLGIVTRTDLIRHLFSSSLDMQRPRRTEITEMLSRSVNPHKLDLLWQATDCAHESGFKLYIVGGFVRDLLLDRENFDIDLVVEGDAIALAKRLASQGGGRVRSHDRFRTAKWILEDGESLDFVTARTEFYAHPTALPQVESSSIRQDLHRRDFTINTLAIRLDRERYVELLDFYGGKQDLRTGVIRVLHSLSLVEDPTRILRAARLEQRLEFQIEPRTRELISSALPLLGRISGERIRHELYLLFQEPKPELGLARMEELGIIRHIHPGLRCDGWLQSKFRLLRQVMDQWYETSWKPFFVEQDHDALHGLTIEASDNTAQLYLALLTYRLIGDELETLISRIKIVRDDTDLLHQVAALRDQVKALQIQDMRPSQVVALLKPFSGPAILVTWIASDSQRVHQYLTDYWQTYRHVQPLLTGDDLKEMGLAPGPIFSKILWALRSARLDGQIATEIQERDMARQYVARHIGEPAQE